MGHLVNCPVCPKSMRVPRKFIGVPFACPACKSPILVRLDPSGQTITESLAPLTTSLAIPKSPPPPPPPPKIVIKIDLPPADPPPRTDLQDPPFFVDDGVVIVCPWCNKRTRVPNTHYDDELVCKRCRQSYKVLVNDTDEIRFKCPNCLVGQAIHESMAGEIVSCVDSNCGYVGILVPDTPQIRVVRVDDLKPPRVPPSALLIQPPPPPPRATYVPPPPSRSSPNLCRRCGDRYVRNPTGYCYKCQS